MSSATHPQQKYSCMHNASKEMRTRLGQKQIKLMCIFYKIYCTSWIQNTTCYSTLMPSIPSQKSIMEISHVYIYIYIYIKFAIIPPLIENELENTKIEWTGNDNDNLIFENDLGFPSKLVRTICAYVHVSLLPWAEATTNTWSTEFRPLIGLRVHHWNDKRIWHTW